MTEIRVRLIGPADIPVIAALRATGGEALITADHGNCEQMRDYDANQPHTQHTTDPVPLVYVGPRQLKLSGDRGKLADVAPTLLALMGLAQPPEMTGRSLLRDDAAAPDR